MREFPYIVFGSPIIDRDAINGVMSTLESTWIGTGPRVHELEEKFAGLTGARYALATSSCTAALHLAMVASGVGPGDEVITTPMTFCATANAIIHTGATPVFVDCQRDTMTIDPAAIEAAVTPKTRAIVPVHFAGRPAQMDAIAAIAKRHRLLVVEDAAHAIESVFHDRKVGSLSPLTCFSFYATKNMTTAEGGMLTLADDAAHERLRTLRLHGLDKDAWKRYEPGAFLPYETLEPGYKYNMTDLQASLGLHQLARLEANLRVRQEIWNAYDEAFADLDTSIRCDSSRSR
jgi:dTDP-4-amino-4,6-dideoxygalactose transaminase